MGTINDVREMAISLLNKEYTIIANGKTYVISPSKIGYRFEFDTAKRRFGCCNYVRRVLSLSLPLCSENLDKIDSRITNTMLHEIAHALSVYVYGSRNGRGHGANWKNIAKQIGCDAKRCYDSSSVNMPKHKYSAVCPTCDRTVHRHRMTVGLACGVCCGKKYDPTHKFIWKINH